MENSENKLKNNIDTQLDIPEYFVTVNQIVDSYFEEGTGAYVPHYGNLTVMMFFYNRFYKDKEDEPITDAAKSDSVVHDPDFIKAYNAAISDDALIEYNFANAYNDALDIVDARIGSGELVVEKLKSFLPEILKPITDAMQDFNSDSSFKVLKNFTDSQDELMKKADELKVTAKESEKKETAPKRKK